jgi:hypothetical protein
MKTILSTGTFVILVSILLNSCDPAIGYEYYLNNKSDKKLKIFYTGLGFNDTTKTVFVQPRTKLLFYDTEIWGKNPHDEENDFLRIFDTLSITPTDTSKLLIDYLQRSNWVYSNDIGHIGFIKTGTNIYKLEITNDNFEK